MAAIFADSRYSPNRLGYYRKAQRRMKLYRTLALSLFVIVIGLIAGWTFNHTPYPFLGILIALMIPVFIVKFLKDISK
jgi:hypothetical protein